MKYTLDGISTTIEGWGNTGPDGKDRLIYSVKYYKWAEIYKRYKLNPGFLRKYFKNSKNSKDIISVPSFNCGKLLYIVDWIAQRIISMKFLKDCTYNGAVGYAYLELFTDHTQEILDKEKFVEYCQRRGGIKTVDDIKNFSRDYLEKGEKTYEN